MTRFEHIFMEDCMYKDEYYCNIYDLDTKVGYCKYYKKDIHLNSVYIEYIKIFEEHRRKGYATEMVKELQSKYILLWEYSFTHLGRKWFNKLVERDIVKLNNEEVYNF